MFSILLIQQLLFIISCNAVPAFQEVPCRPTVTLASGVLVGTTTSLPGATATVNKFLSVPFAASPPIRFSPPQDLPGWYGERDASQLPPACLQQYDYPASYRDMQMAFFNTPPPPSESEDCLYLNVFAPATGGKNKAVMFWIHGGGLIGGYSGFPFFDGSSFASNQDVIVVTTNYRTNVFGFSNSPEIPLAQQNTGFLDQRKALQWVQENIHAFGGDKNKVTVFGESAGGYSIKQLLAHPPSPLPFRAAIMQSGAAGKFNGTIAWNALVANLSCTDAPSPLACVRAVDATIIQDSIEHLAMFFAPAVDDVTNSLDVTSFIQNGSFTKVPLLIGTNADEGSLFVIGQTNATAFIEIMLAGLPQVQQQLLTEYSKTNKNDSDFISGIATDMWFQCAAMSLSSLAVSQGSNNKDVWRYYFNATFTNSYIYPDLGVYHTSEIPLVFGTYNTIGATPQQVSLSKYMQTAWANFAKHPHKGPGWSRVKTKSSVKDLGILGGDAFASEVTIPSEIVDQPGCDIVAPYVSILGL